MLYNPVYFVFEVCCPLCWFKVIYNHNNTQPQTFRRGHWHRPRRLPVPPPLKRGGAGTRCGGFPRRSTMGSLGRTQNIDQTVKDLPDDQRFYQTVKTLLVCIVPYSLALVLCCIADAMIGAPISIGNSLHIMPAVWSHYAES